MEPKVILVNYKDEPIGEMAKSEAHATPNLHRAFSVFLYQGNKILLQRREEHKYHCGGLWTNTCCSHPRPGEETLEAARRRLEEEMQIKAGELEEITSFTYYYAFSNGIFEYEYDHVIMGEYDGTYEINPEEVAEAKWVEKEVLEEDMRLHPEKYTPWFLICANEVLKRLP